MSEAAKPAPLQVWEKVAALLHRTQVPGGWIYRTTDYSDGSPALVFVPHPPEADEKQLFVDAGEVHQTPEEG